MFCNILCVLHDFRRKRIFVFGNVVQLFQHWQITIGFNVTHRTRVTIPVPSAAKVATLLYDTNIRETLLTQSPTQQQTAKAATNNHNFNGVIQRFARYLLLVRVIHIV